MSLNSEHSAEIQVVSFDRSQDSKRTFARAPRYIQSRPNDKRDPVWSSWALVLERRDTASVPESNGQRKSRTKLPAFKY